MNNPKVSIIIPVYKTEKYLEASVKSAINQTYGNLEIILVDDGSPDNSPAICDDFAKKYAHVSVIHKPNGGLSSARNAGIQAATGTYILFLDSDDRLVPNTIELMVDKALSTGADCVVPNSYFKVYENKEQTHLSLHFESRYFEEDPILFALNIIIQQGRARRATAVLYEHSIIRNNNIEFPDKTISEDFFFNLDYMLRAKKLAMLPPPTLLCLKRNGSISSSYFEDFFSTIIRMDDEVSRSIEKIDSAKYGQYAAGKRESLLFRNVLIYVIQVLLDPSKKYGERKKKALEYLAHPRVEAAIAYPIRLPYFDGFIQRTYMRLSLWLWRHKCYSALCRVSYWAGLKNRI